MKVSVGSMMRASCTVSASCAGIEAELVGGERAMSGSAKTIPSSTSTPVTTISALTTWLPSRHADSLPDVVRYW